MKKYPYRAVLIVAIATIALSSAEGGQVVPTYVALKTATTYPLPHPVDGMVTLTLASSATIRLRATDIDYERSAAYKNTAVITAETVTARTDPKSGRRYVELRFSRRFTATAWDTDVDHEVMRSGFAAFHRNRGTVDTAEPLAIIRAKCAKDWPDDFVMRNHCEEQQLKALEKLRGRGGGSQRQS